MENIYLNPNDIKLLNDVTTDSYSNYILDNSFLIFTSIDNVLILVYLKINKTIIIYDLINFQKLGEIKYHHHNYINSFKYFFDKKNKKDLIMSISCEDNNLILWDLNKLECILNIITINKGGVMHSACFLNDNENYYILTSNSSQHPYYITFDPIKIFDFNGIKVKEINNSNDKTYYIDTYYDNKIKKNFIITCNFNHIKSYDYEKNELYHKYYEKDDGAHYTFSINNIENITKIFESSNSGIVRIWNFHSSELLDKISINNKRIFSICLWDNNYLFAGCDDNSIKLIELKTGKVVKNLEGHNNIVLTIKKINHPKFGECLISKGFKEDPIKIWAYKI